MGYGRDCEFSDGRRGLWLGGDPRLQRGGRLLVLADESIAALIFRLDGEIVAIEFSNYHNPCSFVFRPYLHDDASDHAQYSREEAIFRADHTGSFGEKVFLPA